MMLRHRLIPLPTARLGMYMKIARDLNRSDVRAALEVWNEELTRKFQVPSEVRFYSDIDALRHAFDTGEVNLVSTDAMPSVRHFKPEELASGFTAKLPTSASLFLLGRPGGGLEQLAGKQVDFALVNQHGYETAIELNPQLRKAGEMVDKLSFETQFFGFFSSKVSPKFQHFALRSVENMHLEPRGRQMLGVFKTDRVTRAEPIVLKPFYQLEREYRELKAKAIHRGRKP